MSDKTKGFIWGVITVIAILLFMIAIHSCNTDTPSSSNDPTNPAPVSAPNGGTGSGPDGMYNPPDLTIPQIDIPSVPPVAPPLEAEPAQAAPAVAQ